MYTLHLHRQKQKVDYPSRNLLSGRDHIAPPTARQHDSVHTLVMNRCRFTCKQPETVLSRGPELFSLQQWVEDSQNWCERDLNYLPTFKIQYIQSHSSLHYIHASIRSRNQNIPAYSYVGQFHYKINQKNLNVGKKLESCMHLRTERHFYIQTTHAHTLQLREMVYAFEARRRGTWQE